MRHWFAAFVLVALAGVLAFAPTAHAEQCAKPVDAATEFGALDDPTIALTASGRIVHRLPREPDFKMRYAMLRLRMSGERQGQWLLTIRDENFKVLAIFGPNDFPKGANGAPDGVWTGRLEAADVYFDLFVADKQGSDVNITVDEALMMPADIEKDKARYSWKGSAPTYVSLYDSHLQLGDDAKQKVRRLGDRVGFVIGMARPEPGKTMSWCCSGIMLTDDLFLTNWHCGGWSDGFQEKSVWSQDVCNTTFLDLSWDEDQASREYGCRAVIATMHQKELDYTLIRVTPLGGEKTRSVGRPVSITTNPVTLGDEVRIIHHAECKRKQVSIDCHVTNAARPGRMPGAGVAELTDFAHDCDTEGGSSGAPVFGVDGALVGLHRAGHESSQSNQCDYQNKAVHIRRILEDIKASRPEIYEEIRGRVNGLGN